MRRGWYFLDDYMSFVAIERPIVFVLGPNKIECFKFLRCDQLVFPFSEFNGDRAGVHAGSKVSEVVDKPSLREKNFKKSSNDLTLNSSAPGSGAKIVLQVSLSSSTSMKPVSHRKRNFAERALQDFGSDRCPNNRCPALWYFHRADLLTGC